MHRRLIASVTALALAATPADAQVAVAAANNRGACNYDQCALRFESREFLRGREGQVVGRITLWSGTRLTSLVGANDSAQYHAAEFDQHYVAGRRWAGLGASGLGLIGGIIWNRAYSDDLSGSTTDWLLAGGYAFAVGLTIYGGRRERRGERGLARALWWHNRDLAPSP